MEKLLMFAAIGEGGTGLVLLVYPQIVTRLFFGTEVTGVGIVMSRIAGIALIGLGVGCWTGRNASAFNSTAVRAIFTYSLLVAIYLAYVGIATRLAGIVLWLAVAAHLGFTVLVVAAWRDDQRRAQAAPRKAA